MPALISADHRANAIGSGWMIAAMAAFSIEDVFIKAASETIPVGQVLILFGLGGAVVFAGLSKLKGDRLLSENVVSRTMWIRMLFEILGRLFYGLAIVLTPLSSATVILQATPIAVVAGAALVFGERVGWRRWMAIVVGLAGVVVIIRPGSDSFSALSVLAVLGTIGFAGRDLASRAAPSTVSTSLLGLYGFLAIIAAGVLYSAWSRASFVSLNFRSSLSLVAAVAFGVAAYTCLMKAMRTGEVSAVTPFRYSRLLFGIAFGIGLFGEQPDIWMLVGCGLIVAAGLFIIWQIPGRRHNHRDC